MTLHWTPALATGVDEIDRQHQELFRRASRLVEKLREGDRSEVDSLVAYLAEYVVEHFGAEERVMEATGYPGLATHRAEHARFRADFQALAQRFAAEHARPEVALALHNWLSDWLRAHVGGSDAQLGRFLLSRRDG
jgi:hemerythrin